VTDPVVPAPVSSPVQPEALPAGWARLHPVSPVIRASRAAVGLGTVFAIRGAATHESPWEGLALFVLAVVAGVVYWLVTRWRVHDGELQIDTGLLRRQQVRVPLTRIQGIDLVRPLLARALGVSELKLVLAGHDTGSARLAYLSEDRAAAVRAQLLALAHGLDETTPEPAERPIFGVHGGTLVASYLLTGRVMVTAALVAATTAVFAIYPQALAAGIGPDLAILGAAVLGVMQQIAAEWDFQLAEAPDGLRLRSGLLQTRAETVPHGRVQAIRWVEPVWWRPMGWVRLEFDVARRRNVERTEQQSSTTTKALLPVGSREEARWLLSRLMPGATAELSPNDGVPRRAAWRVPMKRRFARVRIDDGYVACCHGRIRPDTVVVPLQKIQSIRWSQGPVSRRLHLGSVLIDTAGRRFTASARFRDEAEAHRIVEVLPDLARTARARTR
jgi:putative membrane protein